jgi:glycosyltransferase involved in cell wall biosynthesis
VITVCRSLTDGVRARAPRTRVFQVEDPPLVDDLSPDAAAVAGLRRSLGLGPGPVVLYSGNLEPYQGVELLVDAAAGVPEAWFVIMGGEPAGIAALRSRSGAARCVFAGPRPPSELPAFLGLAEVVVSPRLRGENTPFKVYTYLASGKPLVATRLATHTQLIDDSMAFLVEPTAAGLAGGIRAVLADPSEAARRAGRGRALIERDYSAERFAEKVARAYAELAGEMGAAVG